MMNRAILRVDGHPPVAAIERIMEVVSERDGSDAAERWLRKRAAEEQHISYYHAPTRLPVTASAHKRKKLSKKEWTRRKVRSKSR
jgi:hypothetical protein